MAQQYSIIANIIANTDSFISSINDAATQTDQLGRTFADRTRSMGEGFTNVGKKMSLLSVPIIGVGVASSKMAIDFEAQMSRVGAIAGATGGEMDALKNSAMELGADTSKSAGEVAVAMEEMAAMGFTAVEIMGAMPGVISASEASGESLALASQTVAAALNIWGLEAGEASRVADVLAMAANESAAGIGDMQLAFKYAGAPAAALGIEMEDVAAAIGIMTDAGLDGSNAGTSLRASLLALNNPAKAQAKIMDQLGISMRDGEGNAISLSEMIGTVAEQTAHMTEADKVATVAKLVGTEAVSGFLSLMKAGPEEIDKMSDALRDSAGVSAETAAIMKDNLGGSLEELGGSLETAAITIGNILIPHIQKAVEFIQELVEKFTALPTNVQETILIFAGIVAAIGPVLLVVGTLLTSISSIVTAFTAVSGAITAAGGVMALFTNPIGWVIAAIGLVVAASILFYKNFEKLEEKIGTVGTVILGLVNPFTAIATVIKLFKRGMEDSIEPVERFGDEVSENTQKAVGAFMDMSEKADVALKELAWSQETVTKEMATDMKAQQAEITSTLLNAISERHTEEKNQAREQMRALDSLSDEQKNAIIEKINVRYAEEKTTVETGSAQITEIYDRAANNNRHINEAESNEILAIRQDMTQQAVVIMSENEIEQKIILEKMKDNAGTITALEAAEVVKNAVKKKDDVIKEANDQFDETYAFAIRQRDELGTMSAEEAKLVIDEAKKKRDESVKHAESMHADVVEEAKLQAEEHVNHVDWETGEIKSKWEIFKGDIGTKMSDIGKSISTGWKTAWTSTKETFSGMWKSTSEWFTKIDTTVNEKIESAKKGAKEKVDEMARNFVTGFANIVTSGREKFNELKSKIVTPIEAARDTVKNVVDTIKGFFTGMKLEIPSIKLPKLPSPKISGSFSLDPPSVPKISWNALGGVFTKPTVLNTRAGLQGFGEVKNESEAILPLNAKTFGGIGAGIVKAFGNMSNPQQPVAEGNIEIHFNVEKMTGDKKDVDNFSKQIANTLKRERGMR